MSDTYSEEVKFKVGRFLKPGKLIYKGKRIYVKFGFNRKLINEIKAMHDSKWHGFDDPPVKMWSIANNSRNKFQLDRLLNRNPYAWYDQPLVEFNSLRPLREHQIEMVRHVLTYKRCIIAGEMGTGKTLVAIEVAEALGLEDYEVWYVGPKSGIKAVGLELDKWGAKVSPRMFTYERMTKYVKNWGDTEVLPKFIIFDESSKLKTPSAQRSQAADWAAEALREEYGEDAYILEMSGTPAPKAPTDWWNQCEIACPGFLREGNIHKFKARLCIIEKRENKITGGVYPHVVSWLDDRNKCAECGQLQDSEVHSKFAIVSGEGHEWKQSKNEVEYLYKRMKGLVMVKFKKDCLDLPEIQYEEIQLTPTIEMLRAAKLIATNSSRAVTALTLCRELADGFQYKDIKAGEIDCPNCHGKGTKVIKVPTGDVDYMAPLDVQASQFEDKEVTCDLCGGSGQVHKYKRDVETVGTPKDEYFKNDLANHEDIGRYLVWGGFTGTIDRLVDMAVSCGWTVLRVDGRGYHAFSPDPNEEPNPNELLIAMDRSHPRKQEMFDKYPRVCFVGHPEAGGMALTLHASPTALFYSNSFKGEARMQAEHRAHRMGMDENKGLVVKDLLVLPTDKKVLNNLKEKKKLQNISMGELKDAFRD
jgi:hypothetical protein